jgi:large conductance mechanosensitive channel
MGSEFRKFALKGNVIDLAIGVIVGGAFGKVVSSLVTDVIMPPIGLLLGRIDFSNLYINLSRTSYPNLAAAKDAGSPTINVGVFINTVVDFGVVAFVIFLVVRGINRMRVNAEKSQLAAVPITVVCPFCKTQIAADATRCPHCTSDLRPKA